MSVIGRGISDNEAWADMTDAQRWAYARRLEDAVTETVKELGTLRQQHRGAVEALKLIACARAQSGQHAIDVGLARNALEAMGVDPSLWRGQ